MALLLKKMYEEYLYYNYEVADSRTKKWTLIRTPFPVLSILAAYQYFIFVLGPKFMNNREPMKLDKILIVYNLLQITSCLFLVYKSITVLPGENYSLFCEPIDFSDNPIPVEITSYVYYYFLIKLVDLLDTVFFVLRKKYKQITFLHVYHHTGMVILGWGGTKYLAGGHGIWVGTINCTIHAAMYFYYLLSVIKPEYKNSVWWKKYITQMQMLQFLFLIWHFLQLLFQPECNYPKWTIAVFVPQNIFMLVLFADFYRKTYMQKKPKQF